MPVEPIECTACTRKFAPSFALCPFCNAPAHPQRTVHCDVCQREYSPGLTACPFCHPERVAPVAGTPSSAASAMSLRPDFATPDDLDDPLVSPRFLLGCAIAFVIGLIGTIFCAWHYDVLGTNYARRIARLVVLAGAGGYGWVRIRGATFGSYFFPRRFRPQQLLIVAAITIPVGMICYTVGMLYNGLAADPPIEVRCQYTEMRDDPVRIECRTPHSGVRTGFVPASALRDRLAGTTAFTVSASDGPLAWLLHLSTVAPARGMGSGLTEGEVMPTVLMPGGVYSNGPLNPGVVPAPRARERTPRR